MAYQHGGGQADGPGRFTLGKLDQGSVHAEPLAHAHQMMPGRQLETLIQTLAGLSDSALHQEGLNEPAEGDCAVERPPWRQLRALCECGDAVVEDIELESGQLGEGSIPSSSRNLRCASR